MTLVLLLLLGSGQMRLRRKNAAIQARNRFSAPRVPREESSGARRGLRGGLAQLLGGLFPNTYYSRPNYRYPYYDNDGKGYLLYGYGDEDLYEYSIFKPLEGYFKR